MSKKNREPHRSARERLQQERETHRAREKRKRMLVVSAGVVGVIGLAAVAGVVVANAGKGKSSQAAGPVLAPLGVNGKDDLAVPVGAPDAPATLTVWEDFRCPGCAAYEKGFRTTIHELVKDGQIKVEYHLATIIDGNMGGSGSKNAANAAACAQDAGKFVEYHDVLYKNQPPESDDAFANNSRLLELAGQVEGLKPAPGFRQCVEDSAHNDWVEKSAEKFRMGGFRGTPTVLLNGESILPTRGGVNITPGNLKKWVAEVNKGKKPGTATPSASESSAPAA